MLKNEIEQGTGRRKADLVLKNGRFVNVFTGEVTAADIAVCGGKIVGFGAYEGEEEIDVSGKIVLPGYIDAHVHIESSHSRPRSFPNSFCRVAPRPSSPTRTRSPTSAV